MSKLRMLTLVSLLIVAVAVACSSSDQGAIDKAVSATLAAAQPATVAPTATSTPEPVPTDTPAAVAPPPSTPKPTATPEPTQVATATLKSTPAFDEDYIRALNKLLALDYEWRVLTTFMDDGTPYISLSWVIRDIVDFNQVSKKLNALKFDLSMTNVPDDLKPIKNGLNEIYEIEVNAFGTGEWNGDVTPSNVVEIIAVIEANPGPIRGLYDRRWTEAQLMRKKLYEYWITEMIDKGLDMKVVEKFAKNQDELGAITNFGK